MLTWHKENNKYLGFDDDCYTYRVARDDSGWYYEHIQDLDGMDGYDTAEEAMAAAEAEFALNQKELGTDEEGFELIDIEESYWDEVAHERMENNKGAGW